MGLIRILLAWSVVIYHSTPIFGWELVHGGVAVESFFVISGFYMTLILTEKYPSGPGSYGMFISSRFLRLFPSYWIVLIGGIAANLLVYFFVGKSVYTIKLWEQLLHQGSWAQIVPLFLSNGFFLGQEFYQVTQFSPDFMQSGLTALAGDWISGKSVLMLPQAWSISVEIQFYLLAPLLVRLRTSHITAIMAGSFILRGLILSTYGMEMGTALSYYLFPTELGLFLMGALGYRAYAGMKQVECSKLDRLCQCVRIGIVVFIVAYQWIPLAFIWKEWLLIGATALSIPFVFRVTKKNRWDREFGELSYPIYICHVTIAQFSDRVADRFHWGQRGLLLSVLVFGASWLLYRCVDHPLDEWKQRWIRLRSGKIGEIN